MSEPLFTPAEAYAKIQALVARGGWLGLDTETTGLGVHDQVVDLAIVDDLGNVCFESLARPMVPMHPEAYTKTGITSAMLEAAPRWSEVWARATSILAGRELVAFNAAFDQHALEETCRAHCVPPTSCRWTCAQQLLSPLWSRGHVSLARVCQDLGIEPGTHRAASDARAMVLALRAAAADPMIVRPREPAT